MTRWQQLLRFGRRMLLGGHDLEGLAQRQRELKADVELTRREVETEARYRRMQHEGWQ